ncbi:SlyX family protein [Marinagarivorans algicola]|uniref:SlyX family protein n=1 Tax=Marinagarivorans algicola TaxID=1513270 RepID=UPI0006B58B73|nr:SlyX family protein [Marinagarivorans algicola]
MNDDIADLQLRVSFQDEAMIKLSDQIALHDKELREAKLQIKMLREKLMDVSHEIDQMSPTQKNERPPHY